MESAEIPSVIIETSLLDRIQYAGPIVSSVLFILIALSIVTWAILLTKWIFLKRTEYNTLNFIKSFWDSRSLNDLNNHLSDYPPSPVKEIFRSGYAELVRGNQLKEQSSSLDLAIHAAMQNLARALHKAKILEKKQLERFLPILAVSASAAPFIGLFGTVWGIMTAFEGIARTGSSSLAAVAPGISEALIATAFGLAAAIPAVVGYNIAATKIRNILAQIEGFGVDFLNIVERYLVSDRSRGTSSATTPSQQPPRI